MNKLLIQYFAVGGAGFFGAVSRFAIGMFFRRWAVTQFPLGTFIINITGSFILGWFLTVISTKYQVSDTTRLAIAVGFIGTYTTFSTWTYDSLVLFDNGRAALATINIVASVALGLVAVRLGMMVGGRV